MANDGSPPDNLFGPSTPNPQAQIPVQPLVPQNIPNVPGPSAGALDYTALGLSTPLAMKYMPPTTLGLKSRALAQLTDPSGQLGAATRDNINQLKDLPRTQRTAPLQDQFNQLKEYRQLSKRDPEEFKRQLSDLGKKPVAETRAMASGAQEAAETGLKEGAEKVAGRAAAEEGAERIAARLGTGMLGKFVESSAARGAADLGAQMGLRMAAFTVPGAGWAIGGAMMIGFWMFDKGMRSQLNSVIAHLWGGHTPSMDSPPSGGNKYLPACNDHRDKAIRPADAAMDIVNASNWLYDPSKVWHPSDPEVKSTPDFHNTLTQMNQLLKECHDWANDVNNAFQRYGDQQYVQEASAACGDSLKALANLGPQVINPVGTNLGNLAVASNTLYQGFRNANAKNRQAIANSATGYIPGRTHINASSMATDDLPAAQATYNNAASAALTGIDNALQSWNQPAGLAGGAGINQDQSNQPAPQQTSPSNQTPFSMPSMPGNVPASDPVAAQPVSPAPAPAQQQNPNQQLAEDLLRGMQQQSMSPFGQMSPLAQMGNQLGSQLGQLGSQLEQRAMSPLDQLQQQASNQRLADLLSGASKQNDDAAGKKDPAADKPAAEPKKPDTPAAKAPGAAAAATPAANTDGGGSGGPGGPGKKDPEQPAPPAAPDAPAAPSTVAKIDGHDVNFPDARAAKLAQLMNPTDGSTPPTLENAAAQAGYTVPPLGHDIGHRISPQQMQNGDVIIGNDHKGVFIGNGQVLSDGHVMPIGDVAKFTGEHQGAFRLDAPGGQPAAPAPAAPSAGGHPVVDTNANPNPAPAPAAAPDAGSSPAGDANSGGAQQNPATPAAGQGGDVFGSSGGGQSGTHEPPQSQTGTSRIPTGD